MSKNSPTLLSTAPTTPNLTLVPNSVVADAASFWKAVGSFRQGNSNQLICAIDWEGHSGGLQVARQEDGKFRATYFDAIAATPRPLPNYIAQVLEFELGIQEQEIVITQIDELLTPDLESSDFDETESFFNSTDLLADVNNSLASLPSLGRIVKGLSLSYLLQEVNAQGRTARPTGAPTQNIITAVPTNIINPTSTLTLAPTIINQSAAPTNAVTSFPTPNSTSPASDHDSEKDQVISYEALVIPSGLFTGAVSTFMRKIPLAGLRAVGVLGLGPAAGAAVGAGVGALLDEYAPKNNDDNDNNSNHRNLRGGNLLEDGTANHRNLGLKFETAASKKSNWSNTKNGAYLGALTGGAIAVGATLADNLCPKPSAQYLAGNQEDPEIKTIALSPLITLALYDQSENPPLKQLDRKLNPTRPERGELRTHLNRALRKLNGMVESPENYKKNRPTQIKIANAIWDGRLSNIYDLISPDIIGVRAGIKPALHVVNQIISEKLGELNSISLHRDSPEYILLKNCFNEVEGSRMGEDIVSHSSSSSGNNANNKSSRRMAVPESRHITVAPLIALALYDQSKNPPLKQLYQQSNPAKYARKALQNHLKKALRNLKDGDEGPESSLQNRWDNFRIFNAVWTGHLSYIHDLIHPDIIGLRDGTQPAPRVVNERISKKLRTLNDITLPIDSPEYKLLKNCVNQIEESSRRESIEMSILSHSSSEKKRIELAPFIAVALYDQTDNPLLKQLRQAPNLAQNLPEWEVLQLHLNPALRRLAGGNKIPAISRHRIETAALNGSIAEIDDLIFDVLGIGDGIRPALHEVSHRISDTLGELKDIILPIDSPEYKFLNDCVTRVEASRSNPSSNVGDNADDQPKAKSPILPTNNSDEEEGLSFVTAPVSPDQVATLSTTYSTIPTADIVPAAIHTLEAPRTSIISQVASPFHQQYSQSAGNSAATR